MSDLPILHIAASSACLVGAGVLLHRHSPLFTPTRLSFASIGFWGFVLVHFLPTAIFVFDPEKPKAVSYLWAVTIGVMGLALGSAVVAHITRFDAVELIGRYRALMLIRAHPNDRTFLVLLGAVCASILALYVVEVPSYPLYWLLSGRVTNAVANQLRAEALGPDMGSPFWYLFGVTRAYLMPVAFLFTCLMFRHLRSVSERILAMMLLAIALVYNSWTGAKTPVAVPFLLLFLAMVMRLDRAVLFARYRAIWRRRKRTILLLASVMLLVVALYPVFIFKFKTFGQGRPISEIFALGVLRRVFYTPAFVAYMQFEVFPELVDFTRFRDIGKLATVLGLEPVPLSNISAELLFGNRQSHSPPSSFGNFYAQAGWPMVVAGGVLMGVVLQGMQVFLARFVRQNVLTLAVTIFLFYATFRLTMTNFHGMLLSEGVVPSLALLVARGLLGWTAGAIKVPEAPERALGPGPASHQERSVS